MSRILSPPGEGEWKARPEHPYRTLKLTKQLNASRWADRDGRSTVGNVVHGTRGMYHGLLAR
jgi:hypothetical protein